MQQIADKPGFRKLGAGQVSQLTVIDRRGGGRKVIYETAALIEAPNWTPDGASLIFNGGGGLFRVGSAGGVPELIDTGRVDAANNDHLLSPDGRTLYLSAAGHVYSVPITGGEPRQLSQDQPPGRPLRFFLHGISPDGRQLVCVGIASLDFSGRVSLYTLPATGGPHEELVRIEANVDGPEYSPDGRWLYFNSELHAQRAGHSQIFRLRCAGTGAAGTGPIEQVTADERVNWFPHLSPDGCWISYLSFPERTLGHPADRNVILRVIDVRDLRDGGPARQPVDVVALVGGQGTLNVNSWAPDSERFAYVAYPARHGSGV